MIGIADEVVIFLLVTDSGSWVGFINKDEEEEEERCSESMDILDIVRSSSRARDSLNRFSDTSISAVLIGFALGGLRDFFVAFRSLLMSWTSLSGYLEIMLDVSLGGRSPD